MFSLLLLLHFDPNLLFQYFDLIFENLIQSQSLGYLFLQRFHMSLYSLLVRFGLIIRQLIQLSDSLSLPLHFNLQLLRDLLFLTHNPIMPLLLFICLKPLHHCLLLTLENIILYFLNLAFHILILT